MVPKERINITIFTDGSCNAKSDRKLGGFGVYIPYGNQEIHLRRGFWNTTTSRMEMKALLAAIQMIDPDVYTKVHVVADSEFVVNAFKKSLLSQWRANGWWGVKNPELWKEILKEIESRRKMVFGISHINGHGKTCPTHWFMVMPVRMLWRIIRRKTVTFRTDRLRGSVGSIMMVLTVCSRKRLRCLSN